MDPGPVMLWILAPLALSALACKPDGDGGDFARLREAMVATQIAARGVRDPLTLAALRRVPRHLFVPPASLSQAYDDHPLPIGHGQTISQPYIVGFMTEALVPARRRDRARGRHRLRLPGRGAGARSPRSVYTIEIVAPLAQEAAERLKRLGYANVSVRAGDGYLGWPEAAPFDAIIVTAAAPRVPEPLRQQLRDGGRMILPLGEEWQELVLVTRRGSTFDERRVLPVRFVPMTGKVRQ